MKNNLPFTAGVIWALGEAKCASHYKKKKKRLRRRGRNLMLTGPQLTGRRVSNWVFSPTPPSPFLLLLVTALPSLQPLPTKLPGARKQGSLPAYTALFQSFPYVRSRYVCTPPLLLYVEPFFPKSEGSWMSVGGKANSTSYFQTPAPHITHSLFKCSPWKTRISITSILRQPAEQPHISLPHWEADALPSSPSLSCFVKGLRCERGGMIWGAGAGEINGMKLLEDEESPLQLDPASSRQG